MGIDLGTTYSVIAVRGSGGGTGDVEIIRDEGGRYIIPSVVWVGGVKGER